MCGAPYVLQAARPQTCTKENLLPLGLQVQIQVSVVCVRACRVCMYVWSTIRSSGCTPPNPHQRKPSSPGAPSSDTGQCSVCSCVCVCVEYHSFFFFRLHTPTLNPEATYMGSSSPQKPPERIKDFRQNVICSRLVRLYE